MDRNSRCPAAVILCLTATGLSVARSLGINGIPVIGLDGNPRQIGHFSKYVGEGWTQPYIDHPEKFVPKLISIAENAEQAPVLFAAGDDEIQFVSQWATELKTHYIMPESYNRKFSGLMLDKIHFYKTCLELGAEIPKTLFPESLDDVSRQSKEIRYPAIIKPGFGHAWRERFKGKKVLEVSSPSDLDQAFRTYSLEPKDMVIQEVVPGKEENIAIFGGYFNKESEPLSVFTAKKTRQYPPMFGSASLCESLWYPEIADMSIDLVRRMGYHGICGTEYKWDPRDNRWKLMEINFRPTLWFAITRASGVDVVYDAYQDLIGRPVETKIGTQKNGVLWQYLVRDMASVAYYLKNRDFTWKSFMQFLHPKKEYAVLSTTDWRTNLAYPRYTISEYLKHR